MTLQELSKYYKLHERLERNREMLSSLYAAAGHVLPFGLRHISRLSSYLAHLIRLRVTCTYGCFGSCATSLPYGRFRHDPQAVCPIGS